MNQFTSGVLLGRNRNWNPYMLNSRLEAFVWSHAVGYLELLQRDRRRKSQGGFAEPKHTTPTVPTMTAGLVLFSRWRTE
jgi:hypothetical protein